jgi:hypothetical protein
MRYWSRYLSLLPQQEQDKDETDPEHDRMPPTADRTRRSGGKPLPAPARQRLERGLGTNLRAVRLRHAPQEAAARSARAFAEGKNIVVAHQGDAHDLGLLAHEAAHIAQTERRGAMSGVSDPGSASEREARAASEAVVRGGSAQIAQSGSPVPAVQRQERSAAVNTVVVRESVRFLLLIHYNQQQEKGTFKLTAALKSELRRLIPVLEDATIAGLWTPEPANAQEAYQRILNAGLLPMAAPSAQPETQPELPPKPDKAEKAVEEPGKTKKNAVKVEGVGSTGLGIHLIINPRAPAPVSAVIRQELGRRGLPFSYDQIQTLLAGRDQGVEQIETILKSIAPGLNKEQRNRLAKTIADAILTKAVQGQLSREAPTAQERTAEIEARLNQMLGIPQKASGGMLDLLGMVPLGVSVTIYF